MSSRDSERHLYLQHIEVQTVTTRKFRVKFSVDTDDIELRRNGQTFTWSPSRNLELTSTDQVTVSIKVGHTVLGVSIGKMDTQANISGEEIKQAFWNSDSPNASVSRQVTFAGQPTTIILRLRPSDASQSVHVALRRLQNEMKRFKPLMADWVEKLGSAAFEYALILSEFNSIAKAAVGVVKATFELLKEQQRYDNLVANLANKVERITPFVERVDKETKKEDMKTLETVIRKLYDVIVDTAEFICHYVTESALKRTGKSLVSSKDTDTINELDEVLGRLVEDFDRNVGVEALIASKASEFMDEDRFLRDRLDPSKAGYKAGYNADRGCMSDTRVGVLDNIVNWALQAPEPNRTNNTANLFWLYGIPGVGKTAVASSLCSRLYEEQRLGGSFFCRRDDPYLREPKYVFPRLIFELAEVWPSYRKLLIKKLKDDSKLSVESSSHTLFLQLLEGIHESPPFPFVLVIDALDECGEPRTRERILKFLLEASSKFSFLKIIVTSRQEHDIHTFFESDANNRLYISQDLATDKQVDTDMTLFIERQFSPIATRYRLLDWPRKADMDKIVASAGGLFIYMETVRRLVEDELDPEEALLKVISRASGDKDGALYQLYSSTIESKVGRHKEAFQRAISVIIAVSPYRPLGDKAVATLSGLTITAVRGLVDSLNSLFYYDHTEKDAIRVRHLSIIDFLTDPNCPPEFQVNREQANEKVGLACLSTMICGLKFNICGLETSLASNDNVEDLTDRVDKNISDALQYSCIHWANHVCSISYPAGVDVLEGMKRLFEGARPLFWIEVLSVMRKVPIGIQALRHVVSWTKASNEQFLPCVKDTLRFSLTFHTAITTSAPHIYTSALSFIPTECQLWKNAHQLFKKLMRVKQGRMELWPMRPVAWHGHKKAVCCIGYAPNGLHIVSGSADKTLRMWDAETGRAIGEPWEGHTSMVWSVAYSPDGRHVVSGSADSTLRLWDVETGRTIGEPWEGHIGTIHSVAYSPDGRHVVSGSADSTLRLWDAETGRAIGEPWEGHFSSVFGVVYSPNGRHIVSGSWDDTLRMWDVKTGCVIGEPWRGHTDSIRSVAYSPDGRRVISGSDDETVRMWDADTGRAIGEPWEGHTSSVYGVAYSPNGRYIVSGSKDKTIRIWDAETGKSIGEPWKGHTEWAWSVAYSPDGRHVISGSRDTTLRMWSAETGRPMGALWEGHTDSVDSVAYSPDGRYIVSGSWDNTIRMWDAETGRAIGEPWKGHTDQVWSIAYSPDGRHVISGSRDDTLRMWDAETGSSIGEPWVSHTNSVTSTVFSPDGRHVVSGSSDETLRMWDVKTRCVIGEPWRGHTDSIRNVAYSPDGRRVISGSDDETVRMWDADTGQAIGDPWRGHHNSINNVAYSPDGCHIVSGSQDKTIRMWDAENGRVIGEPWQGHTESVSTVAYSPDGCYVVSGSIDSTIRIWDTKTGCAIGEPWRGHLRSAGSVAYSPDGRHIVSGSRDRTIRVWDTSSLRVTNNSFVPNTDGWITNPDGGLIFWVPEDCRNGLIHPVILTIPINGPNRVVQLDSTDFRYGTSWTEIYSAAGE